MSQIDITGVSTSEDIANLDISSIAKEALPSSLYDAVVASAKLCPNEIAIRYILDGECLSKSKIPFSKKLLNKIVKLVKRENFAEPYREISFLELSQNVTQVANALRSLGVEREDVTSIVMPNFPETYFSLWGASTAGIANPINPLLDASIIKEIIISANSKVLIALGPVPGSDIWQKILEIKDQIPSLQAVICVFGPDLPKSEESKVPVYSFKKLVKRHSKTSLVFEAPSQDDVCAYFHTGGTTGLPKLAKHTHLNQLTNAAQVNLISPVSAKDTIFVGLPIFHVNAAVATGIGSVMNTSTILLASPAGYRGNKVMTNLFQLLRHYKVKLIMAVPTVYSGLLAEIEKSDQLNFSLPDLKLAVSGAAPLSSDLQTTFMQKTGIKLIEGYGSTESSSVTSLMPINSINEEASVGLIIPGMKVATVTLNEQGELVKQCAADEVGEIVISGNNVFSGYLDDAHNAGLIVGLTDGNKYIRTGDLGKFDKHGYLILAGRQKELIIRGGHNIDPKMIEDVAMKHPSVQLAAAVPRPDSHSGEIPVLYVTKMPSANLTEEALNDFMKKHTPERAAIPKTVYVIDDMPLTAVGKIFKPELVCFQIADVISAELEGHLNGNAFVVKAQPDKILGIKTEIRIEGSSNQAFIDLIQNKLLSYSFAYELEFGSLSSKVS